VLRSGLRVQSLADSTAFFASTRRSVFVRLSQFETQLHAARATAAAEADTAALLSGGGQCGGVSSEDDLELLPMAGAAPSTRDGHYRL